MRLACFQSVHRRYLYNTVCCEECRPRARRSGWASASSRYAFLLNPAFALTAINEYIGRMHSTPQDFAEQHLYHEMKLIDGAPTQCGTWQSAGAKVLSARGECREVV